jgi:hypothetical protein
MSRLRTTEATALEIDDLHTKELSVKASEGPIHPRPFPGPAQHVQPEHGSYESSIIMRTSENLDIHPFLPPLLA